MIVVAFLIVAIVVTANSVVAFSAGEYILAAGFWLLAAVCIACATEEV